MEKSLSIVFERRDSGIALRVPPRRGSLNSESSVADRGYRCHDRSRDTGARGHARTLGGDPIIHRAYPRSSVATSEDADGLGPISSPFALPRKLRDPPVAVLSPFVLPLTVNGPKRTRIAPCRLPRRMYATMDPFFLQPRFYLSSSSSSPLPFPSATAHSAAH